MWNKNIPQDKNYSVIFSPKNYSNYDKQIFKYKNFVNLFMYLASMPAVQKSKGIKFRN